MPLDLNNAIAFAQLVKAAYAVTPGNTANAAGTAIPGTGYTVVTTIYANDLATDMLPARGTYRVSIGLILQEASTGGVVIAIRGTDGVYEWVNDAEFGLVTCPCLPGSGRTEDGFTAMYNSLTTSTDAGSPTVVQAMQTLAFPQPITSVAICGHSLGGALVTLLALDLAVNSAFKSPAVYTYASPRTGDSAFVTTYNQLVPNTYRIANRLDLVPKLPLPPFFDHVLGLSDLNPVSFFPPKVLIKPTLACQHSLDSYLHLLSTLAGGTVLPLDQGCVP